MKTIKGRKDITYAEVDIKDKNNEKGKRKKRLMDFLKKKKNYPQASKPHLRICGCHQAHAALTFLLQCVSWVQTQISLKSDH